MSESASSTASSTPERHSGRDVHPPLTFAEEQAAAALTHLEQRDLTAALRRSLASSWDSEDEVDYESKYQDEESDDEKEPAVKKREVPVKDEEEWTEHIHPVEIPLPRFRATHQPLPSAEATPLELLQLFLSPKLMEEFVQYTNAAAPQDWKPTTVNELYAFIGAHVFMGIVRLPRTEMYWSKELFHAKITSVFSQHRFKDLQRFFSVVQLDEEASERDPMPHVRALADKLNAIFSQHYSPSLRLVVDEAMVAFKGKVRIKQYIPAKPHKWGYKIYCLCSDDYLLHFEIYEGKEEAKSELGSTVDMILRFVKGYEDKELVLFADSWFTSPKLMNVLKEKGIRLCGSCRRNRAGLPKISDSDIESLHQGEWLQRQKGDMSLAVWKDKKVMRLLYNHCSPQEVSSLQRYDDFGKKVAFACPLAVHDYFLYARAVDVFDQLHYGYLTGRKSKHCWSRLAWWLIDSCIINAYKLWSFTHSGAHQLSFRIALMNELLSQYHSHRRALQETAHHHTGIPLVQDHYPVRSATESDCVVCSQQPHKRARSRVVCHACHVHLCLGECYAQYHANI